MENGFFGFMNRIGDIVFLNVVFLITCIPVVTIGNSLIALYCVSLKMAKGEEGYVVRGYFKAFKDNFKKGIIVGIGGIAPGLSGSVLLVIFGLYQKTSGFISSHNNSS